MNPTPTRRRTGPDRLDATPPDPSGHHVWQRLYHGETRADIVHRWKLWFLLSGLVLLVGLGALFVRGLNMGIDFTGGTVWQVPAGKVTNTKAASDEMARLGYSDVQAQLVNQVGGGSSTRTLRVAAEETITPSAATTRALDRLRRDLDGLAGKLSGNQQRDIEGIRGDLDAVSGPFRTTEPAPLKRLSTQVREFSSSIDGKRADAETRRKINDALPTLRRDVNSLSDAENAERARQSQDVTTALAELTGSRPSQVTVDSVGPSWGQQISEKARTALIVFLLAITLFITIRFELKMALATVAALFHDLLVVVGIYALLQLPVTPATVVALLTMLGFSIYDGIVVFDRVNENQRLLTNRSRMTYTDMANLSLNQVLMRSLNTSITTLLPILSVLVIGSVLLGASTLREFGVALFLGLLSGAYSSIFIATPLLALLKEREPRYRELRHQIETTGHGSVPAEATAGGPARDRDGAGGADEERVEDDDPVKAAIMAGGTAPPRPRKKGRRR